jgi:eukaryotic-like serine/threonine-protein kinase
MLFSAGDRLGPYEISGSVGKGGMGEVYRARDTRLNRDVAIKVSSDRFSERFEREARVVASLNHPNICTLHDLGPNYLVMELVEGPTLAERIASGPIPLEDALAIARQIADALEAAHEKGITHRDLKPANVKVSAAGVVKVLDFGLAKVTQASAKFEGDVTESPTISMAATQAGVILGTAAYMSPEQASGKPVDKRADIWSFGVVLCEMLTGKRLFAGETISHTMAAVLVKDPDWSQLPPDTPASIRRLLRRCLERDIRRRLLDIGSVRLEIEAANEDRIEPQPTVRIAPSSGQARLWQGIAAASVLAFATVSFFHFREKPPLAEPVRFQIPPPVKNSFDIYLALSPDGRRLAFTATSDDGASRIWVRDMGTLEARPLTGTEGAGSLFWSPDSRFIAFGLAQQLKKIDVAGGPPQTLCESANAVGSGAWSKTGVILFGGRGNGPLQQVSEAGGAPAPITALDRGGFHTFPSFLPDGRHFIYFRNAGGPENIGIYLGSLDAKPTEQSSKRLVATGFGAVFASDPGGGAGSVLFLRDGTLMAQPLDATRLETAGEAVPVAERVGSTNQYANVTASANGLLAYRTGGAGTTQLTWFDPDGKRLDQVGEPGQYTSLAVSPDGTRAAVRRLGTAGDLWLLDLVRGISTRFTFAPGLNDNPLWSPDGSQIVFRSNRGGKFDLYRKVSNGAGEDEVLLNSDQDKMPTSWSWDGRYLLYQSVDPKTATDIWVLPLEGDRKPISFLQTPFAEGWGAFSPDGRWIAYISTESGNIEVYVRPFAPSSGDASGGGAGTSGKWQVSKGGAIAARPFWCADGKEIYYRAPSGAIMAVDVTTSPAFQIGRSRRLFDVLANLAIDVPRDGKRFLIGMPQQDSGPQAITVVMNWQAGMKK